MKRLSKNMIWEQAADNFNLETNLGLVNALHSVAQIMEVEYHSWAWQLKHKIVSLLDTLRIEIQESEDFDVPSIAKGEYVKLKKDKEES